MPKSDPFITATPKSASIDDYVDLTWGNLPSGKTCNLMVFNPSGDGGTIVLDMKANSTYQYPVTTAGTYEFRLVQGSKTLASSSVTVT